MLAGLKEYLENGLKPPPIVCKATEEYRQEMDSVGQWIGMSCGPSSLDPPGNMTLKAIHESYEAWAAAEKGWVASKQKLAKEFRNHGFESTVSHGVTKFKNIRVKDLKADDDQPHSSEDDEDFEVPL